MQCTCLNRYLGALQRRIHSQLPCWGKLQPKHCSWVQAASSTLAMRLSFNHKDCYMQAKHTPALEVWPQKRMDGRSQINGVKT